jgi:hypothetical protein
MLFLELMEFYAVGEVEQVFCEFESFLNFLGFEIGIGSVGGLLICLFLSLSYQRLLIKDHRYKKWSAREDLNLHGVTPTGPSNQPVYQFQH